MFAFIGISATAFILCAALGPVLIPFLHRLKFGQSIRGVGPASHQRKSGTPTMGGLMLLAAMLVSLLAWERFSPALVIALVLTLGHGLVGFIDDYIKVWKKRNLGLTVRQKFALQFLLAGAYVYYAENYLQDTKLWLPLFNVQLDWGWAYYLLAFLLLVGTTNAVNLTDGLDGLVSWVTLPVAAVYAYLAAQGPLPELSSFAAALFGSCAGFLLFNHYPAKVFMGDTGSLALGGAVAALALLTKTELLLIIIGGIYVAEAGSVILQVAYFRHSHGRRLFRMAPLHHHFELGGWKETTVVFAFALASLCCCLLGLGLWLI